MKPPVTVKAIQILFFLPLFTLCFVATSHAAGIDCDRAVAVLMRGQYSSSTKDAIRYYTEAIELCPGFARPYELLGNLYRKQGEEARALELFEKAAGLGSKNHKLYYLLADLLFQKGRIDEAHRYLTKSLSLKADYQKALALRKEIERSRDGEGPKIDLYEPAARRGVLLVCKESSIAVRGVATDRSGLAWVRINGSDVPLDRAGNFLRDVPLKIGKNTILVEASDRMGNRSSIAVVLKREKGVAAWAGAMRQVSSPRSFYRKSYAVVIGINRYERWPALEFAVSDARAVGRRFAETGFDQVWVLLDRKATQRRILTLLGHELPRKITREDRLVVYFAGHGQTEELPTGATKGYIIPADADTSNYFATAISMEQIRELSSLIAAKHILYVMDCCYSGLGLNRSAGVPPGITGYLRKVASMRTVQIITAGGKGEQAQERGGHGLFTRYFLRAIGGEADINNDGVVTGTELGAYLRPQVSIASKLAQTPLYGRLEGEGEVLFFVKKKQ